MLRVPIVLYFHSRLNHGTINKLEQWIITELLGVVGIQYCFQNTGIIAKEHKGYSQYRSKLPSPVVIT